MIWIISIILFFISYFPINFPAHPSFHFLSIIFAALFAIPTYWSFIKLFGKKKGILFILFLGIFGICFEALSIKTSFPYGAFYYGEAMGLKIFNLVPITLLFTWPPLLIASYVLGKKVVKKSIIVHFLISLLFLVGIDFLLDPGAVKLGYWIWEQSGIWYGIPFTNYLGWCLSGSLGLAFLFLLDKSNKLNNLSKQQYLYLISNYLFSLFFWGGIGFFLSWYALVSVALILFGGVLFTLKKD